MADTHHHLKQQFIKTKFPRGAVEIKDLDFYDGWVDRLVPAEKPPNPAHQGLRHVSLDELLKDPRNLVTVSRSEHDLHHNAINPVTIDPPPEAWEFARWLQLDWRLG